MNRASPVEMRQALETVQAYKAAGILFVAMPVFSEEEKRARVEEAYVRMGKAENETEYSHHGH
tara:strand:- start:2803 stop:2991 length:189 start_codon:yes stop_codon:yes gene_type:complete